MQALVHTYAHTHTQLHTHTFSGQSFNLGASYVSLPGALRDFLGKLTALVALIYRDKRMCVSVSMCVVRVCVCSVCVCCTTKIVVVLVMLLVVALLVAVLLLLAVSLLPVGAQSVYFWGLTRAGGEVAVARQLYTTFGSTLSVCPTHKHMQIDFGLN